MAFLTKVSAFLVLGLGSTTLSGQAVQVAPLAAPQLWQRAEFRVANPPPAANNFDPAIIQVDATFTAPSGEVKVVPAFWFQNFNRRLVKGGEVLDPAGAAEWRIRFTPTESGEYLLSLAIKTKDGTAAEPTKTRFVVPPRKLPAQHGWVRNAADGRYFETSDGKPLRLVGENVCWAERGGTFDYDAWFGGLKQSGQNFARLWLSPWFMGLEHTPNTLTNYKLDGAWQLDRIFDLAEQHGIYLMLCFDHHGMFQTDNQNWGSTNNFWKTNPYNQAVGGPCATPNDFFTDPAAQAIYQKRLRYLIARYGYSAHLLAWQFYNEIDNVYAPRQSLNGLDVTVWHGIMGRWLRANDPYRHLITSSLTGGSDRPELWNLPEMDITMYHSYGDPAPARWIAAVSADFTKRYRKPVMIGEYGVSAQGWALHTDPHLRGLRQALWSGALSGSVGSAMTWWWQDIHSENVYPLFKSMTQILGAAGWQEGAWAPIDFPESRAPVDLESENEAEGPFSATFALSSYRRTPISWDVAVADRLSAERGSEAISAYLHGSNNSNLQKPLKLTAFFGPEAKLVFRVNSVASDVELIVLLDGAEAFRTQLVNRDGLATVSREIDKEFSVAIPPGKHVIQIVNASPDWAYLDLLRLDGVQPAHFPGKWRWTPETLGLRNANEKKAALYVYSPYVVYPAGAFRYHPPVLERETVTLPAWPAGRFVGTWYDPKTGQQVARTEATTANGVLILPLPPLADDLAAVVTPSG